MCRRRFLITGLGDLISKASGRTFEDFVQANILKPIGMNSSTLLLKQADPARMAGRS
jgi:CubicO group peptidase (beta-lactamase class C family)